MDNLQLLKTHHMMTNLDKMPCYAALMRLHCSQGLLSDLKMFKFSIYSIFTTKGLRYQVFVSAMFSKDPSQTAPSGQLGLSIHFSILFLFFFIFKFVNFFIFLFAHVICVCS